VKVTVRLFYSYSHKDEDLRNELEKHLCILQRRGLITYWHDRRIGAGKEWEEEISSHLESAQLILLLISADFIASDYCYSVEMKRALQRHEAGEAHIIPIILRPVDWVEAPFSKLQILPTDAKPVTRWEDRDEAFSVIVKGIREAIEGITIPQKRLTRSSLANQHPLGAYSRKQAIGYLLPFLCNRGDQEHALDKALQYQKTKTPRRPFICITYGNEYECHDMFRKRLKDLFLPRFLKLSNEDGSIEDYLLQWPSTNINDREGLEIFRRDFAEKLSDDRDASIEKVFESISAHKTPILVYSYLSIDDWSSAGLRCFDAYIKFWQSFPDLPPRRFIISCLFFTYRGIEKASFFEKRKLSKLIRRARIFFEYLDLSAYENIHGVILPELHAIPRQDVENWIREGSHFRGICSVHSREFCNVQGVIEEIRSLYEQPQYRIFNGRIPMELLAKELYSLLEAYHCKGA
jgi:inactive STAND/TIR domain